MLKFRTHGKWILGGEHSVLRGGYALAFPTRHYYLDFEYEPSEKPLNLKIFHSSTDLEMAFWGVLEKSLQTLNLSRSQIYGNLKLSSNIPVGAGMGASATLCVSLAKWFTGLGHLPVGNQYKFAKSLENLFHGESSGVDVAVTLRNEGIEFKKPDVIQIFRPCWTPFFYLSYCGKRGMTSDCVRRVQEFIKKEPVIGKKIDGDMQKALNLAKKALGEKKEISKLVKALHLAESCFERWSLIGKELREHMSFLKQNGALATKPTGSGDGGFVLSLWNSQPPGELSKILIRA